MWKSRIGVVLVVAATLLPGPALGRGFFPFGFIRHAISHVLPFRGFHARFRHHRRHVERHRPADRRAPNVSASVRNASLGQTNKPNVHGTKNPLLSGDGASLLAEPARREQLVAVAALALWHSGHHDAGGWWSHGNGEYGWVGPLFWPFAYDDVYDYVMLGAGAGFWDYGYPDIFAGIFVPYSYNDLAAYLAPASRRVPPLQDFCGPERRASAGSPIEQIEQTIQPSQAQRAALDDLAKALTSAARLIQASCPTKTAVTAPDRLAAMLQRVEAMSRAVILLEPPLRKLYRRLDERQKTRLDALAAPSRGTDSPATLCQAAQQSALQWPAKEIETALHPDDAQRAALKKLQHAGVRAVNILNDECRSEDAATAPARLYAVDRRLDAMQQAIQIVSNALDDFYATLSDEQKAQFEAIGPRRTA